MCCNSKSFHSNLEHEEGIKSSEIKYPEIREVGGGRRNQFQIVEAITK